MPQLYNDDIENQIRTRFIQKCDDLISTGRVDSYAELCRSIEISPASFNQVKTGVTKPTLQMLYNLQSVYKVSVESILFINPPKLNMVFIRSQLSAIQESLEKLEGAISV
ncbi:hypothetical protein [Adhaeribacter aquaticus]|uniref:hypothetical protein n=1 Tax=Adhaeribacter aquaticus TaxID=299567 RepID=UPI000404076A|nr:hypothetical protein [Adhaeribacter aquaticus]